MRTAVSIRILVLALLILPAALSGAEVLDRLRASYPQTFTITQELTPVERESVSPTLVTMHLKNASALDVAREVTKQAKLRLIESPPGVVTDSSGVTTTIDLEGKPLWWAMGQAFEGRDNVSIRVQDENSFAYAVSRGSGGPVAMAPWTVGGPFLVKPMPPRWAGTRFEITIWLWGEPKITVLNTMLPTDVSVIGDHGEPYALEMGSFQMSYGPANHWTAFNVNFLPDAAATRIARIKGVAHPLVEIASDRRRVPATVNAEVSVGGLKLAVTEATVGAKRSDRPAASYTIILEARDVVAGDREKVLQLMRGTRVVVWDAEFAPLAVDGIWHEFKRGKLQTRIEGVAIRTSGDARPALPQMLQINVPTRATLLDVPFEFTDIPLPERK